jgi:hypothetical protein
MSSKALLREAQELRNVCQRLDLLAEQYPNVTEGLLVICGTIRSTAALLEVLVVTKLDGSHRPI